MGSKELVNSNFCRLCASEYTDGFSIFEESEDKASLVILINKYLPINVVNDDVYPKNICEQCHSGVAAIVDLIDRMVEGQHTLRQMIQEVLGRYVPPTAVTSSTNTLLVDLQGVEAEIPMDDLAKGSDAVKIYDSDHQLSHNVAGTTVKKKRGRPRQSKNKHSLTPASSESSINSGLRPRRKVAMPSRFRDTVAGEALETLVLDASGADSGPSIVVAGGGVDGVAADVPFALNIEIIEQDGRFILRGIEHLGDLKQLEAVKAAQHQYPNSVIFSQSNNIQVDGENKISLGNGTQEFIFKAGEIFHANSGNMDLSSLRTEHLSDPPIIPGASAILQGQNALETITPIQHQHIQTFQFDSSSPSLLSTSVPALNASLEPQNPRHQSVSVISRPVEMHLQQRDVQQQIEGHQPLQSAQSSATVSNGVNNLPVKPAVKTLLKRKKGARRKPRYKCNLCGKTFLRQGRYKHHLWLHGSTVVRCLECKEQFSEPRLLLQHQQLTKHSGTGIMQSEKSPAATLRCAICPNRTFKSTQGYQKHKTQMHEGNNRSLQCGHCDRKFVYTNSLQNHIKQFHPTPGKEPTAGNGGREYPCSLCGKVFHHPTSLAYHTDTAHNAGRFFVCSVCDATFKHKQLLQRHYASHSDARPYPCEVCGMTFKSRCNLLSHSVIHNKEKKFTCELCGKQFNHLTSIKSHLRLHTGEKPYICEHCGKSFAQTGNLQEHVRIHTGERPFSCPICDRCFTTSSQLRLHGRSHQKKSLGATKERKQKSTKGSLATNIHGVTVSSSTTTSSSNRNFDPHILSTSPAVSIATGDITVAGSTTVSVAPTSHDTSGPNFYTTRMCSQCYETLADDDAIAAHKCQPHQLASHTWLMTEAGPHPDGGQHTAGTVSAESLVDDNNGNIIYILAEKEETEQTFNAIGQGGMQLLQTPHHPQQLVAAIDGEQCWEQADSQQHLQLYNNSSSALCEAVGERAATLLQPMDAPQHQTTIGLPSSSSEPLKDQQQSDQSVTLLLQPHTQHMLN